MSRPQLRLVAQATEPTPSRPAPVAAPLPAPAPPAPVTVIRATADIAVPAWFTEVFEREYRNLVSLAALITGSTATAEDVVQDAFAALLGRPGVLEPGAYVRRSVVNGSIGRLRRLRRERPADPTDDRAPRTPSAAVGHDPATNVVDGVLLRAALEELPRRQRAAIVMRITLGWSEQETADALACAPGTVGSLVHRGLATLRSRLAPTDGHREER